MRNTIIWALLAAVLFTATITAQSTSDGSVKIISAPEFILSDAAKAAGIDGTVNARLVIDETGKVKEVFILAGPAWPCGSKPKGVEEVRKEIKANLLASKFAPATKNGKPIDADVFLKFPIGNAFRRAVAMKEAEEAAQRGDFSKVIRSGAITGRAIRLPRPIYPTFRGPSRPSGPVPVEVLVDEQGNVVLAGAVGGHSLLHDSARDAACDAKFSPTLLSGRPVKVNGVIVFNFAP